MTFSLTLTFFLPAHAFLVRPGRAPLEDPGIHRAARGVRAGQIADAHQELAHDLASGEAKGLLEELHPLLLAAGMVGGKPAGE